MIRFFILCLLAILDVSYSAPVNHNAPANSTAFSETGYPPNTMTTAIRKKRDEWQAIYITLLNMTARAIADTYGYMGIEDIINFLTYYGVDGSKLCKVVTYLSSSYGSLSRCPYPRR